MDYYNEKYEQLKDKKHRFIKLSWASLKEMFIDKKSFILYFGGSFCRNCQAVIGLINDVACSLNTDIYNFSPIIDKIDIRKTELCEYQAIYRELLQFLEIESKDELPLLKVPTVINIKCGKPIKMITREYLCENMTEEIKKDYVWQLSELISM